MICDICISEDDVQEATFYCDDCQDDHTFDLCKDCREELKADVRTQRDP